MSTLDNIVSHADTAVVIGIIVTALALVWKIIL